MTLEDFDKMLHEKHGDKYGIMPPPTTDREALEILTQHFLGDYYSVNPISHEQVNTEIVFNILRKYPVKRKKSLKSIITKIFNI